MGDRVSFNLPYLASSSIAIDPFNQSSLDLIHYMHSEVGVIHPKGLGPQTYLLRRRIDPRNETTYYGALHSNLILVSLDGLLLGFGIKLPRCVQYHQGTQ